MKKRIEIIAISKKQIYSVGAIEITKNGDVYYFCKIYGSDIHYSRHATGRIHWKSEKLRLSKELGQGTPVKHFEGIEYIGTIGIDLNCLPELYKEYKMKKCNGLFAIDAREYEKSFFNMSVAILKREGVPSLFSIKDFKRHQIYIFTDSYPMIAISTFKENNRENK